MGRRCRCNPLPVFFVALALNNIKESIGNESYTALFEGVFMYITAGLLWYVIFLVI
jgi:hypothetical protein